LGNKKGRNRFLAEPVAAFNFKINSNLPGLGCHVEASIRAFEASFGTSLAMVMIMFLTFLTASSANSCTKIANFLRKWTVRLHGFNRECTNIGTLTVQANTFSHHFYMVLF
jgi:hypothetical protein